jgi:hypothetical protein
MYRAPSSSQRALDPECSFACGRCRACTTCDFGRSVQPSHQLKFTFHDKVGVSASATVDRRAPMAQCRAAHHGELLPVALEQSERYLTELRGSHAVAEKQKLTH